MTKLRTEIEKKNSYKYGNGPEIIDIETPYPTNDQSDRLSTGPKFMVWICSPSLPQIICKCTKIVLQLINNNNNQMNGSTNQYTLQLETSTKEVRLYSHLARKLLYYTSLPL